MREKARQLVSRLNRRQTVGGAAVLISVLYLVSRLLGLVRDRLLVTHFGVGSTLDAYTAAFRVPDLLFNLLISGAFAVAFIPVFTEHWEKEGNGDAWKITSSLLNLLVLATAVVGAVAFILADPLTTIVAPGFDPERHRITVELTRIMLITPVMFAVASVLGSVQQAFNRFVFFAVAGALYNFGIIGGILWLAPHLGIYGVAWGVVAGVIIQVFVEWGGLYGLGFKYRPILGLHLRGTRQVLKLMLPRSLDQGLDQLNYIVETMIGSTLAQGSVAALNFANNLKNVPLVLIASSITTAVFPQLSASANRGDRAKLVEVYVQNARLILFLALPSAVFAVVMRGYIVRLLYASGNAATANALGWFAGTIVFSSLFMLVSRVYYAMKDTRTPFTLSLISIPTNIALSFILSRWFGVAGLAAGASIVAAAETVALMLILRRRHGSFGEASIWHGGWRMLLSSVIMGITVYLLMKQYLPLYALDKGFMTLAPKFGIILTVGVVAYFLPCFLLKVKEAESFTGRLRRAVIRSTNLT